MIEGTDEGEKARNEDEMRAGDRKARRMSYTIHTYKPCETFRMHIRLPRWPTVDFRPGRELTFALPLCANSHKDSLSLSPFSRSPRDSSCFALPLPLALFRVASSFFPAQLYLCLSLMCDDNVSGNMLQVSCKILQVRISIIS